LTGLGISSRLAETYLKQTDSTDPKHFSKLPKEPVCRSPAVYDKLRERIVSMLTRATIDPPSQDHKLFRPSDVFLFPSGMSTIYHVHHMLLRWRKGGSVMMGFPYELTLKILETYGPSCQVYSSNSSIDIVKLEQYLTRRASDKTAEARLQAIWCECPSNPLLWTPDLQKIRELADQYDLAVIVDDTIGSSANVDVLNVADVVVTSLTKSFSGFADVMAGRYDRQYLSNSLI
jgi:cystathionine gamma-synthase